jgi:hypothetical protein
MAKKPTKSKEIETLLEEALELEAILEGVKETYRKRDEVTAKLIELGFDQAFANGYLFTIVDNFAKQNTTFRVARFARYELKLEQRAALEPIKASKVKKKKHKWEFPVKRKRA